MTIEKPVILVVEDEILVQLTAVAIAEDAGFEVLWAATADEALSFSKPAPTCAWCSRTFRCRDRWMGSGWRMPFATAGPRSS